MHSEKWKIAGGIQTLVVVVLAGLMCASAMAQGNAGDLAGNWQGTLDALPGKSAQRMVLRVTRATGSAEKSGWHGVIYNLDGDTPSEGRNTTQMSVDGSAVQFVIAPINAVYDGKLSADGLSIAGQMTMNGGPAQALTFVHAEGDAAWAIPEPQKQMPKNADPDWDVVTVKPSDPEGHNGGFNTKGREVTVQRQTVQRMLLFGCGVHPRQIVNAPDWIGSERWDVQGVPDVAGQPSLKQMQSLVCKVLTERFGLVTHKEQRELPIYALTLAKGGPKLEKSAGDPNGLPNENDNDRNGQENVQMTNTSMGNLSLLLKFFMDRPVVDQTGLAGNYDFQLKWTADETHAPADGTAAPSLFTAIQEQLGLKLEAVKAMTDVMVIDKVERPGAN